MSRVSIIVKTFERPRSLAALLASVRQFYDWPVLVADDSYDQARNREICEEFGAQHIQMVENSGLSAGRNLLVRRAQSEYVVLLDDDFVLEERTDLETLVSLCETRFDICAGALINEKGEIHHYEGDWVVWGRELQLMRTIAPFTMQMQCVLNFFAARRTKLLECPWDEEFRMGEHEDFFLSAAAKKLRVGYEPSVLAHHIRDRPQGLYARMRSENVRGHHDKIRAKWGLEKITLGENDVERQERNRRAGEIMRDQLTMICSTIARPACARSFVASARDRFPDMPISMVDQSGYVDQGWHNRMTITRSDDVGPSQAYNLALEKVETEYVVFVEDDFVLTKLSDLPLLGLLVQDTAFDLCAGILKREGGYQTYRGHFRWKGRRLFVEHFDLDSPKYVCRCDIVTNFWVMRTDVLREMGGFDANLQIGGHLDFFLRARAAGLKVGQLIAVEAEHVKISHHDYNRLRSRKRGCVLEKWGLKEVHGIERHRRAA